MKKTFYLLIFLIPLLLNAFSFSDLFNKKEKKEKEIDSKSSIAIGKFQLKGNTSQSQYAESLAGFRSYVNDNFSKNGNFRIINKTRVDEIMATNGLGLYNKKTSFDLLNF